MSVQYLRYSSTRFYSRACLSTSSCRRRLSTTNETSSSRPRFIEANELGHDIKLKTRELHANSGPSDVPQSNAESSTHSVHPSNLASNHSNVLTLGTNEADKSSRDDMSNHLRRNKQIANTGVSQQRSIYVRVPDGLRTLPGILAVVQTVEVQFGKVREFSAVRDGDISSEYLGYCFIHFENPESVDRVRSRDDQRLKIPAEAWDRLQTIYGGAGLEDITNFLRPVQAEPEQVHGPEPAIGVENAATIDADRPAVPEHHEHSEEIEGDKVKSNNIQESDSGMDPDIPQDQPKDVYAILEPMTGASISSSATYFNLQEKPRQRQERRAQISREIIKWGGFYRGYNFSPFADVKSVLKTESGSPVSETTQDSCVRRATVSMTRTLARSHLRLKDLGYTNHGLIDVNGNLLVENWNMPPTKDPHDSNIGSSEKHAKTIKPPEYPGIPIQQEDKGSVSSSDDGLIGAIGEIEEQVIRETRKKRKIAARVKASSESNKIGSTEPSVIESASNLQTDAIDGESTLRKAAEFKPKETSVAARLARWIRGSW